MVVEDVSDDELPSQYVLSITPSASTDPAMICFDRTCEEFCPAVETEYVWPAIHTFLPELEQHAEELIQYPDLIAHVSKFVRTVKTLPLYVLY